MRLIGNGLNRAFTRSLIHEANRPELRNIVLAVAWVTDLREIFELAEKRKVPLTLYALLDDQFPKLEILKRFVSTSCPPSWRLFITQGYYHPKVFWFQGIGAYVGSANLTDGGYESNIECGVWLCDEELAREGFDTELEGMMASIRERCVSISAEHVAARERLIAYRKQILDSAENEYRRRVQAELSALPGVASPLRGVENAAMMAFVRQWHEALSFLRGFAARITTVKWPNWMSATVEPAVAQDRASEWWYERNVRRLGDRAELIEDMYNRNRRDPGAATDALLAEWSASSDVDPASEFARSANEAPQKLQEWLSPTSLSIVDSARLADILHATHAAREHIKQISRDELGLPDVGQVSSYERCESYASILFAAQTKKGKKDIRDLLRYVLWGDYEQRDPALRVWTATQDAEWKLPRIGTSVLGELLGYARPRKYPPRNDRALRVLRALGYDVAFK